MSLKYSPDLLDSAQKEEIKSFAFFDTETTGLPSKNFLFFDK